MTPRRGPDFALRPAGGTRSASRAAVLRAARFAALMMLAGALTLPASAQKGPVKIQVSVIQAAKTGNEVDPRLEDLKGQLEGFGFSSYKLLEQKTLALALGRTGKVDVPGGRILEVTPKGRGADGKLRVRLVIKDLIDTTYAIAPGGTLIVGGPKHGGGTLIFAVTHAAGGS